MEVKNYPLPLKNRPERVAKINLPPD